MKVFFALILFKFVSIIPTDTSEVFTTRVIYNFTHQSDSLDVNTKKTETTELLINDSTSIFLTTKKYNKDSLLNLDSFKTGIAYRFGKIDLTQFSIWKNTDKIITQEPLDGRSLSINNRLYEYQENVEDLDWKLEQDTMSISGIKCQKATIEYGGRNWTAWFSLDIPISNGPYKFTGLPGLIISIKDSKGQFSFDLVEIRKQNKTIIPLKILRPDIQVKKITKQEFQQYREELSENMVSIASSTMKLSEDQKKMIREQANKHSNWIELSIH